MRSALALLVLWFALTARAERARELVLIAPDGALRERVSAELQALGFGVRYENDLPAALARREQAPADRCVLQLETSDEAVHVSVYTDEHGKREEQFGIEPQTSAATLAIRITEFARAVLLASVQRPVAVQDVVPAARPAPAAPPERPALPQAPPAPPPPPPSKAALELGFAALGSPGGLGVGYGVALAAGGFVVPALRLSVSAFAPLTEQSHTASEGSSHSRVALIAGELRGDFRSEARFRPSLGGGFGAAVLATQGSGVSPKYADTSSRRISFGAQLRTGAGYHVTPSFALRLDLTLGLQFSRFALTYAEREGAHWGVPWFMGAFSLELIPKSY